MCSYMNDCNGHGSCSKTTGKCKCNSGFYGADCGTTVKEFTFDYNAQNFEAKNYTGSRWTYFMVPPTIEK